MAEKCFICLDNTTNKVCIRCNCFAHPKCWGNYLGFNLQIYSYIDFNYSIETISSILCPMCRNKMNNPRPITRSETETGRKVYLNLIIDTALVCIYTQGKYNRKYRFELLEQLCKVILAEKKLFFKNKTQVDSVRLKLLYTYHFDDWVMCNFYHLQIFGECIKELK